MISRKPQANVIRLLSRRTEHSIFTTFGCESFADDGFAISQSLPPLQARAGTLFGSAAPHAAQSARRPKINVFLGATVGYRVAPSHRRTTPSRRRPVGLSSATAGLRVTVAPSHRTAPSCRRRFAVGGRVVALGHHGDCRRHHCAVQSGISCGSASSSPSLPSLPLPPLRADVAVVV